MLPGLRDHSLSMRSFSRDVQGDRVVVPALRELAAVGKVDGTPAMVRSVDRFSAWRPAIVRAVTAMAASEQRRRWPRRVVVGLCAFMAFVLVVGTLHNGTQSRLTLALSIGAGVLFALLAIYVATGRCGSDVRRYRAVTRAHPDMRRTLLGTLVIGTVAVLYGLATFSNVNDLRTHGVRTAGTVTKVSTSSFSRSTSYYLTFSTTNGRVVTCEADEMAGFDPAVGDPIEVLYDRTDPTECRDARRAATFTEPTVITVIGLGLLVTWRILYVRTRRRPATTSTT